MHRRGALRRPAGSYPRAFMVVLTLVLIALPSVGTARAAPGEIAGLGTPFGESSREPAQARPFAAIAVTVTTCTTAGYNDYTLGTPNDIGLGGALANGNAITFACNAALSGGPGPYTIVPQNNTTTGAQEIIITGGTLSIDGSDGGRNDITLSGNNAIGVFGVGGGTLDLTNLTIADGNSPGQFGAGGAIFNNGGSVTIAKSTIRNNSAGLDGGAIFTHSAVTIIDSTFSKNTSSGAGGAIANFAGGSVTIINSTFSGNTATVTGGGILNDDTLTVTNSTFDGNSASQGSGIYFNGGTVTLANTILANGACGGSVSLTDTKGNLEFPTNTCGFTLANGDSLSDPKLGAPAGNGGPTQTEALGTGSAAINLGVIGACTASPVSGVDQRGYLRPTSGACDSGAYDSHGTQPATSTTLSVTQPASPPVSGQSFTLVLTAQVDDPGYPAPGQFTPTGTVIFHQGTASGTVLACQEGDPTTHAVPLPDTSAPESVTCTVNSQSLLASGSPYAYTAVYSGDSTFAGSNGGTSLTVNQAATTTTITTCSPSAPVPGQGFTCTAMVSANAPGSGSPSGTVTFRADNSTTGTIIGTCTLVTTDTPPDCTFSPAYSALSIGPHTLYAIYGGDTDFQGSTSPGFPLTVGKADTQTVVTLAPGSTNPATIGQSVTYVATVSAVSLRTGTPTGTVSFTDNGSPIPGCSGVPLDTTTETAACTTSYPASQVGSHTIVATYAGDATFNGSSGVFTEMVQGCSVTGALRVGTQALGVVTHDDNPAFSYPIHFITFAGGSGVGTFTARDPVITLCSLPVSQDSAGVHPSQVSGSASVTIVDTVSSASTPSAFHPGDVVSVTVRLVNGLPGPATVTDTTTGLTYTMAPPYQFGSYLHITTP